MTAPMKAARLEVRHCDDREPTVYEDVRYWPWDRGMAVDVFHDDGTVTTHRDVENTFVGVST